MLTNFKTLFQQRSLCRIPSANINVFFQFGGETPEIKAKRAAAIKKAYKAKQLKQDQDEFSWWNKVKDITFQELKGIPQKQVKRDLRRYLTMFEKSQLLQDQTHIHLRRADSRFQEHYFLKRLISDKEREEEIERDMLKKEERFSPNNESEDLLSEQPRNANIPNYNFEQHKEFTKIYNEEIEKDTYRRNEMKRILKYIKHNPDESLSKIWRNAIFHGKISSALDIDRFVDESVDIEGFKLQPLKNKREVILTKSSNDITDYDCWTCFDRETGINEYHRDPDTTIMLSPKEVRHVFGDPLWCPNETTTGIYTFEDTHLDIFVLAEPHSTVITRGENKDPEYYEAQKVLDKSRREKPFYDIDEFWLSEEKRKFFIF